MLQDLRGEHKQDIQKEVEALRKETEKVKERLTTADEKFLEGNLKDEDYSRITENCKKQIQDLQGRIELLQTDTKGLKEKIDYSVNIIANLRNFMIDAPVKTKCKILSSMFPQKIEFDGEKYRTHSYNQVLDLIFKEPNTLRGYGEKESEKSEADSHSVPRPRIELGTKL